MDSLAHIPWTGAGAMLLCKLRGVLWIPLRGWWSHIVIDVFTPSADHDASPVRYRFTAPRLDGIAWNTPWFMMLNHTALVGIGSWLMVTRARNRGRTAGADLPAVDGSRRFR